MVTLLKEQNDKITAKSFDELISKLEKHGYDCKNCYEGDDYLRLKKDGDTYQAEYYMKDNGSYELYLGNIHPSKRTKKESLVRENNAYPNDWTAETDIHRVFSVLDQTDTKNPGAIEDLYGFVEYDVGWVDAEENIIQIRATMSGEGYGSYETFYVYPSYTKNAFLIDTEELGIRTVSNATDVWDIMSVCLRDQLKDLSSASLYKENRKGSFNMVRRLNEDVESIRFCILKREGNQKFYQLEGFYDSLKEAKEEAYELGRSNLYHGAGGSEEFWPFDTKKWRAYLPLWATADDQKFDSSLPIYTEDDNGKAELLVNYINKQIPSKYMTKDDFEESLITEKNWSITIPSSLSKAFREELDAVDDWDDEETQTEHIQKAMGALINICKFINNRLPDVDFFEDAESEINNLLDNIYNYGEYDMDFDEAKEEIDYFLNDFWEECDTNNIFVQVS